MGKHLEPIKKTMELEKNEFIKEVEMRYGNKMTGEVLKIISIVFEEGYKRGMKFGVDYCNSIIEGHEGMNN